MFFCAVTFYMLFIMILCWLRRFKGGDRGTKKIAVFFCKCYKHQQGADLIQSENSIKARLWHFAIWERKKQLAKQKKRVSNLLSIGKAKKGFWFAWLVESQSDKLQWAEEGSTWCFGKIPAADEFLFSNTAEGFWDFYLENEFSSQTANVTKSAFLTIQDAAWTVLENLFSVPLTGRHGSTKEIKKWQWQETK